jgi:hypothetical protein
MDIYLWTLDYVAIPFVMSLAVLVLPVALVIALLCYGNARSQTDTLRRKKQTRQALWIFLAPVLLVLAALSLWGISHVVVGFMGVPAG